MPRRRFLFTPADTQDTNIYQRGCAGRIRSGIRGGVFLSDGYLTVNGIHSSTRSYGDETISVSRNRFNDGVAVGKPTEEIIYFDADPSWQLEIEDFVDSALNGTPVESGTSEDALKVMQLIYAIYENDDSFMKTGNPFHKNLPPQTKE